MANEKTNEYTQAQIDALVTMYDEAIRDLGADARKNWVTEKATELGKKPSSVVAILSRHSKAGYLPTSAYIPKTGGVVESKDSIIAAIAAKIGVPEEKLSSLDKATKETLRLIRDSIK